ncbi:MAG: nucleotidyltransferase domain-containing protein [Chromatiales bacterium]|nr:nucleotidyltransferase domain-containing protein [Chromatiales bacterium]
MAHQIKDKHRKAIINIISGYNKVERAVLFGSRATGTNTATSDIDIVLFGDHISLSDQARIGAALDEIPMAQTVDLILYRTIDNPTLLEHIRVYGTEWYSRV